MDDGKAMSFVEHLTELRKRMLWSIFALLIGTGVAWNYTEALLGFIARPLTGHTYLVEVKAKVYEGLKERFPALYQRYKLGEHPTGPSQEDRRLNYTAPLEPFFVQIKLSFGSQAFPEEVSRLSWIGLQSRRHSAACWSCCATYPGSVGR